MPEKTLQKGQKPSFTVIIVVVVGLLLGGLWAGLTIRLDTELLTLLPNSLPSVRGLDGFARRFASDREIYVVPDPALSEEARAKVLTQARPILAATPGVDSVVAPGEDVAADWPELAAWALWNLPPEPFARALSALEPERAGTRLASIPDLLAGAADPVALVKLQIDPLGLLDALGGTGGTGSAGGTGTESEGAGKGEGSGFESMLGSQTPAFLIVRTKKALLGFEDCIGQIDALHAALANGISGPSGVLLTGRPAFTAEISRQMRGDMSTMAIVATVLVSVAFLVFYRTMRPLHWILLCQILALLAGLIIARVAFGALNVISMGFASILLGVSMDYCILVYHHFASVHRDDADLWARLRYGIWFSALTTAASFLVLAFSSFPGLRQLAVLVATGLVASALFATWLLAILLSRRPPVAPAILDLASHKAADFVGGHRRGLLVVAGLIVLCSGWLVSKRGGSFYTGDMSQFRPEGGEAWLGQQSLLRVDSGAHDAIYLVHAGSWDAVRRGAESLGKQIGGGRMSPWSYMLASPAHQQANRARWQAGTAQKLAAVFQASGLGQEWSATTMRVATSLDLAAAADKGAFARIQKLLSTLASEEQGTVTAVVRIPGVLENPVPASGFDAQKEAGVKVEPVSWVSLKDELSSAAREDLRRLGIWMFVALALLCALAQKSVRLLILNFVALALSLGLFTLLLVATGTTLSPLSLLCVPLLLGLVIDYSLHILMALEHSQGDLRYTYSHLAAPVVLTGLSACIGFGAPMLTRQPALQNFGFVMDLGIGAAVLVCLGVLPAIFQLTLPKSKAQPPIQEPEPNSLEPR